MTPFVWTDASVRQALNLPRDSDRLEGVRFSRVSTDTRTLGPGDLFVALTGDRHDGHEFLAEARAAGCLAAVVTASRVPGIAPADLVLYQVPDSLTAYGDLARYRRAQTGAVVVGITGSSGKTTVKDLVVGALSSSFRVHASQGNFNNRIGLPRTVLECPDETEVLVLEMGTNEPGEIAELARIAGPVIGVLTTVSETHVEKLKDLDGVLREKLDLIRSLPEGGTAIVGDTPEVLSERARMVRSDVLVAGWTPRADAALQPRDARPKANGCWSFRWADCEVDLQISGRHGVYNALLALAVADALGVPAEDAASGLGGVSPAPMRGEHRALGELLVVVDCYNANPQSVVAGVEALFDISGAGRRIAVLGSMLELGPRSGEIHRGVLAQVLASGIDEVVTVGAFTSALTHGDAVLASAESVDDLAEILPSLLEPGDIVLLKASRGVRLERLLPVLQSRFTGEAA